MPGGDCWVGVRWSGWAAVGEPDATLEAFGLHGKVEPIDHGDVSDVVGVDVTVPDGQGAPSFFGVGDCLGGRSGVERLADAGSLDQFGGRQVVIAACGMIGQAARHDVGGYSRSRSPICRGHG